MKVSNKDKFQSETEIVRNVYEGVKAMAEVEIEKVREGAPINYRLQMQYEMDDTEEINGALDWKNVLCLVTQINQLLNDCWKF